MERYLKKIAIATTIYLLSLGTRTPLAQAGTLLVGKYGYRTNNLNLAQPNSSNPRIINLFSENQFIDSNNLQDLPINLAENQTPNPNNLQDLPIDLAENQTPNPNNLQDLPIDLSIELNELATTETINQDIQDLIGEGTEIRSMLAARKLLLSDANVISAEVARRRNVNVEIPTPEKINQDIQARYQGVIEEDLESISMLAARKLLLSGPNVIGKEVESGSNVNVEETIAMLESQGLLDALPNAKKEVITFPLPLLIGFLLILASLLAPTVKKIVKVLKEEVIESLQEKYGKPKVPEKAVNLHNKTFRELEKLANRAFRISDEKFGNEEFTIYSKIKKEVKQSVNEYQTIGQSIKYLEVAITAQSSLLKLEDIELRFRSRKQQEFYNFVIDTISDDLDKDAFREKVKKKLAQIVPLLNSEEGRNALQAYLNEIIEISKHELGLKLLSLFKKYQLADFTIVRSVSDIIRKLDAQDFFDHEALKILVVENYDVFEKLAPIIGVSEEEHFPETYVKMMQYMGLANRHSKAYQEFESLLKALKKNWKNLIIH